MSTFKTLIAALLFSSVAVAAMAKTPPTPKHRVAKAHAGVSASKGHTTKQKLHSKKAVTKKHAKAHPLAKKNHKANATKTGNGKGPGLEAF